jgi:hypothetical protein
VKLDEIPAGGDFDVLAWLPPALVYVETKSSAPRQIPDGDLLNFMQRGDELAPDVAVLLVDTTDDLSNLLSRLFELMLPTMRRSNRVTDEAWRPERPFIRPQPGYEGISWGMRRYYVTNARPSIVKQLRRVLRHYNARVKGMPILAGLPKNWVTGEVFEL